MRIYSETLPWDDLVQPRTLGLLSRFNLELVLAVRPWDLPRLKDIGERLQDHDIKLSIWPMLSDDQGRWANEHNAADLARFVLEAVDTFQPNDILFDMEPPFGQAQSLVRVGGGKENAKLGHFGRLFEDRRAFMTAERILHHCVVDLRSRGITSSMAVWPMVALDPREQNPWQALLGTPVDALQADHVSVMMYTSILEGWSRHALRRRDAEALLQAATIRTMKRWGDAAGMSLGCIGAGAFEDEPTYRTPKELAEDVAIVRAAGCQKLTLFDLGGVLLRPPAEAWLEAFTAPSMLWRSASSRRVQIARTLVRVSTWALEKTQDRRASRRRT